MKKLDFFESGSHADPKDCKLFLTWVALCGISVGILSSSVSSNSPKSSSDSFSVWANTSRAGAGSFYNHVTISKIIRAVDPDPCFFTIELYYHQVIFFKF